MNTGPAERLCFRDLARQQARIQRACALSQFERLAAAIAAGQEPAPEPTPVLVDLVFRLDESGRVRIEGSATLGTELLCHRCAELVAFPLAADFSLCLVSEAEASEIAERHDVLVVTGKDVSVPEIVEDELLLALPERLCRSDPCERRPALEYPADDGGTVAQEPNPFAALEVLKQRGPVEPDDRAAED